MKKITILILTMSLIAKSYSQVTKKNWLVGGSANFSLLKSSSEASAKFKQTNFQINPIIGYFLRDKFAVGLMPSLSYGKNTLATSSKSTTIVTIGPFLRYYFLPVDKAFNLFTEGSYSYGTITGGQRLNTFSFSGGPVLYFNSTVGLEFIIGYSTTKVIGFSGSNSEIQFGIGFQIHLEKEE